MNLSRPTLSRISGATTVVLALLATGLATALAREAQALLELRTRRAALAAEDARAPIAEGWKTSGRVVVADASQRLPARVSELLNANFSALGFSVHGVDVVARRPLAPGIDALAIEVRAKGPATSGSGAARWLQANASVMAVETISASPALGSETGEAEWTYRLFLLAGVKP